MPKYYLMTTMNYIGYLPVSALIKYNWYKKFVAGFPQKFLAPWQ